MLLRQRVGDGVHVKSMTTGVVSHFATTKEALDFLHVDEVRLKWHIYQMLPLGDYVVMYTWDEERYLKTRYGEFWKDFKEEER